MEEYVPEKVLGFLAQPTADDELRLGDAAVRAGLITESQLDQCLEEQDRLASAGERVALRDLLVRRGWADNARLAALRGGDARPVLGKYRLVREIARGGMGVVYEAEDVQLHRRVALKVIKSLQLGTDAIRRLQREARIVAQLKHPGIVPIHDFVEVVEPAGAPTYFIVMELVSGSTLAQLIQEKKTPRGELLRMLEEVARTVAFAHAGGVLHRDLKPSNVLVSEDGKVYLTDFGLARAASLQSQMTQSHDILGTPAYMAPEQVTGKTREIDERTDVYALGVMMYEILTGRFPHVAPTPALLYDRILREEPVPPRRLVPDLDARLETVCLKAMCKEKRERYASAFAFADDLARIRGGLPIRSHKARRGRAAWIASSSLLLLAGVVGGWFWMRSRRPAREAPAPDSAAVHRERARALMERKEWIAAVAELDQAIALAPDCAAAYADRGAVRLQTKDYGSARSDFTRAIEIDRKLAAAHTGLGTVLYLEGNREGAILSLDEAILLDPAPAPPYALRGLARKESGQLREAVQDFDAAIERDPNVPTVHLRRCETKFALSDRAGAMADLDAILQLTPDDYDVLCRRAVARFTTGNKAGAIADMERAVGIAPPSWAGKERAQQMLSEWRRGR